MAPEPSPQLLRERRNAAVFVIDTGEDDGDDESEGASTDVRHLKRRGRRGRNGYSYQFGWMNNKKFIRQLQKDNIDLAILQSEIGAVGTKQRKKSWRERLLHAIRSNVVQIILCALVLIDAVIVIAEIILEIKAITSDKHELHNILVRTVNFMNVSLGQQLQTHRLRLPDFADVESTDSQQLPSLHGLLLNLTSYYTIVCNVTPVNSSGVERAPAEVGNYSSRPSVYSHFQQGNAKMLHRVSGVLHYVSIGILGLFVLEVLLKVVCLGRNFIREKFEVIDAVVIVISFVADIVFVKVESSEVSVMVLFLLWRIVRVINGLMMHEKQRDEFRIQLQKRARRMSEMKCESLETERDLQEKHILFLEELCRELGASDEQIANCKPRYVNISKRQSSNALKSMAAMSAGIFGGIAGAQHRRSLSAIASNLGTPTTSRQSSALDTIVEDADSRSSDTSCPTSPPTQTLPNGRSLQAVRQQTAETSISETDEGEQPAEQQQQQQQQASASRRNSTLQRQFYVDEQDEESPDQRSQRRRRRRKMNDTRGDSGRFTAADSDSDGEADPWQLREMPRQTKTVAAVTDFMTEYLATT